MKSVGEKSMGGRIPLVFRVSGITTTKSLAIDGPSLTKLCEANKNVE